MTHGTSLCINFFSVFRIISLDEILKSRIIRSKYMPVFKVYPYILLSYFLKGFYLSVYPQVLSVKLITLPLLISTVLFSKIFAIFISKNCISC